MKERWQQLAAKYEALALRERIVVLVAALAAVAAFFHLLAIDPLLAKQRRLAREIAEARAAIAKADEVLRLQTGQADPDAARRAQRDALRAELAELARNMQGMQKELVPPEQMAKLLEGMFARDRGLQLVSLRKLPVQRFERPGAAQQAAAAGDGLYQHSFELVLQGSYADLHDYLARLEKLPWRMFWGKIVMDAENYPKLRVTLTVHTLSVTKAWLTV
ncbi:MAG: hypothetical protein ACK4N4_00695 [Burkholderiales bacterium]